MSRVSRILAAASLLTLTAGAALADCPHSRFRFGYRGDHVPVMLKSDGTCTLSWRMRGVSTISEAEIAAPPHHGTAVASLTGVRYAGRGANDDRFSVRVCGTGRAGPGCSTLDVTVVQ
ncbi:hypothetical protein [uncultured Methylobacterium sp.]|jgi:hypothetical protein|uniref:hypothetical protein n=1 Tax=uncultured Methylobacterium sp. TaxID=157278 RepID=UPI00262B680A|nr:hypothetical protein [uncultured Methylobacterium sp.]